MRTINIGMGAMLLECTGMQPFARTIQREIDISIFSWGTLLDYAYSVGGPPRLLWTRAMEIRK